MTPSFGTLSVNPGASSGKYAEIAITGSAAISLAGKTSTGDDCGVGADTTPDIYANTLATFQDSVLVVCASSSDTTPKVFYSSPTGERIAVTGANLAGSAALATFTHQVTTLTSSEFDSGTGTFTLSYGGVLATPIGLTGISANANKNLIQAELDTSYGASTFTVTEDATKKIFTVTNLKPALSALTTTFVAGNVLAFTIAAATTTPEVGLPGARVQKLVVNGPTTSGGGSCTIKYAATATAAMSPGVTAGTLQAALNAGASNHFTVTSPAANTYLITYAFTASPSTDVINTFACTGADSTTTGVITTVTNEVLSGTVSGKRVQTLTITAAGAATTFANVDCKISYAGATTGFIATKAVTDVAAALNALGKGSFSVAGNAGPDTYTITYNSPSPLGVLSDFVCTDTTKVGTFAITSELALFNDGYTYLNDDSGAWWVGGCQCLCLCLCRVCTGPRFGSYSCMCVRARGSTNPQNSLSPPSPRALCPTRATPPRVLGGPRSPSAMACTCPFPRCTTMPRGTRLPWPTPRVASPSPSSSRWTLALRPPAW